jgi:hypothetical protein
MRNEITDLQQAEIRKFHFISYRIKATTEPYIFLEDSMVDVSFTICEVFAPQTGETHFSEWIESPNAHNILPGGRNYLSDNLDDAIAKVRSYTDYLYTGRFNASTKNEDTSDAQKMNDLLTEMYPQCNQECNQQSYLPDEIITFNPSNPKDIDRILGQFGPEGLLEIARVLKEDAEEDMSASDGMVSDVEPLYVLYVRSGENLYSQTINWINEYIDAHLTPIGTNELKNISYEKVRELNGKHLIYGVVELFEQSDDVPEWYDRETTRYSWYKITN